jgi:hypothetical protein
VSGNDRFSSTHARPPSSSTGPRPRLGRILCSHARRLLQARATSLNHTRAPEAVGCGRICELELAGLGGQAVDGGVAELGVVVQQCRRVPFGAAELDRDPLRRGGVIGDPRVGDDLRWVA